MLLKAVILAFLPVTLAIAQNVSGFEAEIGSTLLRVDEIMGRECAQWPRATAKPAASQTLTAPKPSSDASSVLSDSAQSDDVQTRLTALEGLASSDAAGHVDDFVSALCDADARVRQYAAHILNSQPPGLFIEKVLGLLQSDDGSTSAYAASTIPLLRDSLEQPLMMLLMRQDEAPFRRQLAASALAYMKSTASISALVEVAESADPQLARVCASALGAIPDVVVVPQLVRLTYHAAPVVRYAALTALAAVDAPEAAAGLGEVAGTPREDDPGLAVQAVAYLAERPGQDVIPILIEVMRRNRDAASGAVGALRRLTGEDYGDEPALWQKWWQEKLSRSPLSAEDVPFGVRMMN